MNRRDFLGSLAAAGVFSAGASVAAQPATLLVRDFVTGQPVPAFALNAFSLTDLYLRPFPAIPITTAGTVRFIPPSAPATLRIGVQLDVPNFGNSIWLISDNGGSGWTAADLSQPFDLTRNIAQDRLATFTNLLRKAAQAGIVITSSTQERLARASAHFHTGLTAAGPVGAAQWFGLSLADSMYGAEEVVYQQAQQRLAKSGPRSDFDFGCPTFLYDTLGQPFADAWAAGGFNLAILNFYMSLVQPFPNRPSWTNIQNVLTWTTPLEVKTKGHTLIWFVPELGIPLYLQGKSYPQLKKQLLAYSSAAMTQFKGAVGTYDIFNEPANTNKLNLTASQMMDLVKAAGSQAAGVDPSAQRVINLAYPFGDYMYQTQGQAQFAPYNYLNLMQSAGVDYDTVGLQNYYDGHDLAEIDHMLNIFTSFGKPVHITETECPCSGTLLGSAWHANEFTESIQSDWLQQTYTLYLSKPDIKMAAWWDLADPSFLPSSGLMDSDLNPRLAYGTLQKLIGQWKA